MRMVGPFADAVRAAVRNIPSGHVMSYREVAKRAGYPGAARAVGTVMRHNIDATVPCHRVICADGSIGQFNGGVERKRQLLEEEGVVLEHDGTTYHVKHLATAA